MHSSHGRTGKTPRGRPDRSNVRVRIHGSLPGRTRRLSARSPLWNRRCICNRAKGIGRNDTMGAQWRKLPSVSTSYPYQQVASQNQFLKGIFRIRHNCLTWLQLGFIRVRQCSEVSNSNAVWWRHSLTVKCYIIFVHFHMESELLRTSKVPPQSACMFMPNRKNLQQERIWARGFWVAPVFEPGKCRVRIGWSGSARVQDSGDFLWIKHTFPLGRIWVMKRENKNLPTCFVDLTRLARGNTCNSCIWLHVHCSSISILC